MALRRLYLGIWRLPVAVMFSCVGLFLLMLPTLHAQAAYANDTVVNLPIAGLSGPNGVAVDGNGNIFIADTQNSVVKEALAASGYSSVITLGSGFASPNGVAVDASGNVFVADSGNGAIKEILASGGYTTVNTLGSGFAGPYGVAVDAAGNVFVADTFNNAVKEILAAGGYSTVVPLGSGLSYPIGLALDTAGNVFVADYGSFSVKEILASGNYTTVNTLSTNFRDPSGVAVDSHGNVFVADIYGSSVKEIFADGGYSTVLTLSGGFVNPAGVGLDPHGDVIVVDSGASTVSRLMTHGANFGLVPVGTATPATLSISFGFPATVTIAPPEVLTLGTGSLDFIDAGTGDTCVAGTYFAGSGCTLNVTFTPQFSGYRQGAAVLTDTSGNLLATSYLYGTGVAPQITFGPATNTTLLAGNISPSAVVVDGSGNRFYADSSANTVTELLASDGYTTPHPIGSGFNAPGSIALDGSGNIFVADTGNNAVKEVFAAGGYATVSSLGSGFNAPLAVAVNGGGDVFVIDSSSTPVKEIPAVGGYTSIYSLGTGFTQPSSIAVDATGNVFVADSGTLKEISVTGAYSNVLSLASGFGSSSKLALDSNDNLYVADSADNVVKQVLAAGEYSAINEVGSGFNAPMGLIVDSGGNVFIADKGNHAIKRLDAVDPPAFSFSDTTYGVTSNDSPKTATLTNIGNRPLKLPIPASGPNPTITDGFSIGSGSTCPLSSSTSGTVDLPAGISCTDMIYFRPNQTGPTSGRLVLVDDTLNAVAPSYATQVILLNGNGTTVAPTISFSVANQVYGNPPFTVAATSNSPGAFTYSVVSGPATISGDTVTLTGTGSVTLQASQAAASQYAADSATATFLVATATPTISFSVANQVYGNPPFTVAATSNSPGAFTYSVVSGPATVAGNTVTLTGAGSVTLKAAQPATANFSAASTTATFLVAAATPIISFSVANQTYGNPPFSVAATSTSPGAFTYSVVSGPATVSGSTVTLTGAGSVTLQATQSATAQYAAGSATATFVVATATPTISFAVANQTYGTPPFTVAATSNSPGAFTYSVVSGPATISGNTVTLTGAGSVTLRATQAATAQYAAGSATTTFGVATETPDISFPVSNQVYGNPPFTVTATSNSPGVFTYSVVSGPATISGNTVTLTGTGSVTLGAAQAATANFSAASTTATFLVAAATPVISFSVANQTYGNSPFTVAATSNSPGAFTYSVVSGPASISGNTVTLTGAGSVTLHATQAATAQYAAGSATATFLVATGTPAISFSVANQAFGNPPFTVAATSNSPGAFTYSVISGPATIAGSTITLTGTGSVTLQVLQAATANFSAASTTATFLVAAATPKISFTIANQIYGNPPFTVAATSNSSGAFTYSVVSGPATISGSIVTLTGAGSVTLQASQAATANFSAASTTTTFLVAAATPVISFSVANQVYGNLPFTVAATSNSPGAFTYSVVSGPATIIGDIVTLTGTGSVTLQATQAATPNFTAASTTAAFLVASGLKITATPSSASVVPAGSVDFTLEVSPGGDVTFTHPIQLSATGLPNGATAIFSPPQLPAGANATPVKMTIQTTLEVASEQHRRGSALPPVAFGLLFVPWLFLKRLRRGEWRLPVRLAAVTLLFGALIGATGCGSGVATRDEHFTVVVTAIDTVTGITATTNVDLLIK